MKLIRLLRKILRLHAENRRLISLELNRIDSTYTPWPDAQGRQGADRLPYRLNAPGPFYSVKDGCIICLAPQSAAPDLMGLYEDPSGTNARSHCFFKKQPQTAEEVDQAIAAMQVSCVQNLRYAGDDPVILKRLCDLGWRSLCDVFDQC